MKYNPNYTSKEVLRQLIKMIINPSYSIDNNLLKSTDWPSVKKEAAKQGVLAFIFDAITTLPKDLRPKQNILLQWIGEVIAQEQLYAKHAKVIAELSSFYESHSIKMMLLKGWGLSLNYPYPSHRPTGDIDIWLYGDQAKGDFIIKNEKGINPVKSSHHTIFYYNGVEVENHITFIEVDCHKADGSEDIILQYAKEPSIEVDVMNGCNVQLPSPNLNAYFLLRHSSAHFATEGIILRHLLDWGFFVERYSDKIDWKELYANAKDKNINVFLDCMNTICVEYLGFTDAKFPRSNRYFELANRIWNDILEPEFAISAPPMRQNFAKYCIVKTKRHFANKWKHDITYKEHFWNSLFRFAWNRLKSPYSFGDIVSKNKA